MFLAKVKKTESNFDTQIFTSESIFYALPTSTSISTELHLSYLLKIKPNKQERYVMDTCARHAMFTTMTVLTRKSIECIKKYFLDFYLFGVFWDSF